MNILYPLSARNKHVKKGHLGGHKEEPPAPRPCETCGDIFTPDEDHEGQTNCTPCLNGVPAMPVMYI